MSFKEYDSQPSFFDLEVKQSFGNSRTQKFLSEVMDAIDWKPVSTILTEQLSGGQVGIRKQGLPSFDADESAPSAKMVWNQIRS